MLSILSARTSTKHMLPNWWHLWPRDSHSHLWWFLIWSQFRTHGPLRASPLASCDHRSATLPLRQVRVSCSGNRRQSATISPSCPRSDGQKGKFLHVSDFPDLEPPCHVRGFGLTFERFRLRHRMKLPVLSVASSQVLRVFHSSICAY